MLSRKLLSSAVLLAAPFAVMAQVTTSSMTGTVKAAGQNLSGATVKLTHQPTGTVYTTTTNRNGLFTLRNIQSGGPYLVEVTYVGYTKQTRDEVYINLGETGTQNFDLSEGAADLAAVTVAGSRRSGLQPTARGGVETYISPEKVQNAPTVGRNLSDYFRLVPQAKVTNQGGISIAGQNNRYNQFTIDGANNNDNFGLAESGTNGGQTGSPPISIDAVEAMQIGISPYDVSLGNFTGGSINVITKSGTNRFRGSAYYVTRNENFTGKTPNGPKDAATRITDFKNNTFGFTLGGPIIKNKLFFFISGEYQDGVTPQPFDSSQLAKNGGQSVSRQVFDTANLITAKLRGLGYDPGSFTDVPDLLESRKITGKLTWNINQNHRLNLSYRYTKSDRQLTTSSFATGIRFFNGGYLFPSTTNSASLELNSNFGRNASNKLLVTYTNVLDDRNPLGGNFPRVVINTIAGALPVGYQFGTENFSTANQLKQNNITVFDDFRYTVGRHTLKAGVDFDFSRSYNLFVRDAFGTYTYANARRFLQDEGAIGYSRNFSLVDNINGDGSAAAPTFNTLRSGVFIGDEWNVSDRLRLNFGLRMDAFSYLDQPNTDTFFNNRAVPVIERFFSLDGARSGQRPDVNVSLAPRFGFTYNIPEENLKFRGGLGLFTGRVPLVWPGGVYNNSGVTIGGIAPFNSAGISLANGNPVIFRPDVANQYTAADFGLTVAVPSGQVDLIAKDFRLPKALKASLGIDKRFGKGFNWSVDLLFQKNINEVIYRNVFGASTQKNALGQDVYITPGTTTTYNRLDFNPAVAGIQNPYATGIFLITNASQRKGYSYNFSTTLDKQFANNWNLTLSYSYGDSWVLFDGTSSQNNSQWRFMETTNGRNNVERSRSDYAQLHRLNAFVSKRFEYLNKSLATTITLFYNGQSGTPFSYVYNGSMIYDQNGANGETTDLPYIPRDLADFSRFAVTYNVGTGAAARTVSVAEQWTAFDQFITNDKYLRNRRGQFAERNGAQLPFTNQLDLQIKQDFILRAGKTRNAFTVQFDMFNFSNFLNRDWGRVFRSRNGTISTDATNLLNMDGYTLVNGVLNPRWTYRNLTNDAPYTVQDFQGGIYNISRWRGQLTLRYNFN